jgi:hypothetical protein
VEHHGNPASYKIFNGDVIAIVFTTADAKLPKKSEVPSYKTLQDILGQTNPTEPAPGQTLPNAAVTTTTPSTSAPTTTSKSSAPTTAGATTTSKP